MPPFQELEPLPYHREVLAHLQHAERELWKWFASHRVRKEQADAVRLHRAAHTLKGSLRQFGTSAAVTAQQLENAAEQSQFTEATTLFAQLEAALDQLRSKLLERP